MYVYIYIYIYIHESNCDTNCNRCTRYCHPKFGKGIEIIQNKNPTRDDRNALSRLARILRRVLGT